MNARLVVGACALGLAVGCADSEVKTEADPEPETVTVVVTEQAEAGTTEETTTEEQAEAEEQEESSSSGSASVGDSITLQGSDSGLEMRVTVQDVIDPAPFEQYFGPGRGKKLVAVKLSLANTGTKVYNDSPSNGATIIDRQDQGYTTALLPTTACPDLGSPTIRPDDRRSGCITFEVPKRAKLRAFQFTLDSGFGPETGEWQL
jgi:Domain of unknown function (DUF4352)